MKKEEEEFPSIFSANSLPRTSLLGRCRGACCSRWTRGLRRPGGSATASSPTPTATIRPGSPPPAPPAPSTPPVLHHFPQGLVVCGCSLMVPCSSRLRRRNPWWSTIRMGLSPLLLSMPITAQRKCDSRKYWLLLKWTTQESQQECSLPHET
ncbi:hypothetical protein BT93_H3755 [Corymbia citriodora subsp. variegata]|nr:hypothetical protein BT93_H3755 [Corymbia citriodora subsp. variegata]